jgi:uncharacterized phiE125 gp8 family phage protein
MKLITPPATEPVSLAEAKTQLAYDSNDLDTYISNLIIAARQYCEEFQNRAYITQTLEKAFDKFPENVFELPRPPLKSVTSIKCYDTDNVEHEITNFFVDTYSQPGRVAVDEYPKIELRKLNGVIVRFVAGESTVEQKVKQAMLLLISHWFENREATSTDLKISSETAFSVKALLGLNRVMQI